MSTCYATRSKLSVSRVPGNRPGYTKSTRTVGRSRYIQGLKVKSAVQAIAQFREDVEKNVVPGDADDVGMAAFMVYRLMVRQARISKNHGYFMPAAVKEGIGWLQATFNIGAGAWDAAGAREFSPTDPVGTARDSQNRPAPLAGSWGIPQGSSLLRETDPDADSAASPPFGATSLWVPESASSGSRAGVVSLNETLNKLSFEMGGE